jgi:hypothetical protein
MGIAAGGLIKQSIIEDKNNSNIWESDNGIIFNVQILNSAAFKAVTGMTPPETTVTAKTYAALGYPYYDVYDEKPSDIKGDFVGGHSVIEKDLKGTPKLPIHCSKMICEILSLLRICDETMSTCVSDRPSMPIIRTIGCGHRPPNSHFDLFL